MNDYTHYSLFDGESTVADFAPLPSGGLRGLLAELHAKSASDPSYCVAVGDSAPGDASRGDLNLNSRPGRLHPGAEQVSFYVARRFFVILFTREALESQAIELRAEGNHAAASRASAPLLPRPQ